MKITGIETIRIEEFPNLLWVQLHTDEGLVGLGETFYGPDSAEGHIHGIIAAYLLGQDPLLIDRHHAHLIGYVGFNGSSAEQRGRSAVDIALWDLWGQASGQPIHQLLGGAVRDKIRVYNTCAGYRYVRSKPVQGTANFGLPGDRAEGPYEDLDAFLHRADELAWSLLELGITGMKIWPFDFAAEASQGGYISPVDLDKALEPFAKIRKTAGKRIDVMCELHALWNLPTAKTIVRALEPYEPLWIEDPVFMDQLESLANLQASTRVPIATGETLGGRAQFKELLQRHGCGMAIMDIAWCGGLSEARRIAALAEAWHIPVAFHDCTGPVVLSASTHLALNARHCFIQELVRAFYFGWYGELVTALPPLQDGKITVPEGPGLGLKLRPERLRAKDVHRRMSK
jgi:L-alanine-DL-glutamate epimerase-like enolase superfamily enzyme